MKVYNKCKKGGEQMDFTDRVKKHLKDHGITQTWLCDKTGVTPAAMCRYLQGRRKMSLEAAIKISKALNLPIIEEEDN